MLPRATAIGSYSKTIPDTYNLAVAIIYIDANVNTYKVGVNTAGNVGYTSTNVRTTFTILVKAGDVLKISKESGSGSDPWHYGIIRKIF